MISVEGVSKSYDRHLVLRDITFTAREGSIVGLLGPNGAGKTTTLKTLAGLIIPDEGKITVCGLNMDQDIAAIKRQVAFNQIVFCCMNI